MTHYQSYGKSWYEKNKESEKLKTRQRKNEIKEWFSEYKSTLKCERCGENHPATLQFHHLDPSEKEIGISKALTNGWSKKKIILEVSKCQVLCANCHFKTHYELEMGCRTGLEPA